MSNILLPLVLLGAVLCVSFGTARLVMLPRRFRAARADRDFRAAAMVAEAKRTVAAKRAVQALREAA